MSEPYRGADQDVVPESSHEMEEAADVEVEDRAKAGALSTDVFSDHPVPSFTILCGTFDVRWPAIGRHEL